MEIDLVVPFVKNTDKKWEGEFVRSALKYNPKRVASLHTERFEDIGLINYNLKLIRKNMPWVRKVFLLLSGEGQEPADLPSDIQVVYHKDFIPFQYLPTFNSTTIEMFLWNIKGLGEYFIYINDDMLPVKPLSKERFFDEGKIRIKFIYEEIKVKRNLFKSQCVNSYNSVFCFVREKWQQGSFIRPEHSFTPMIKSHCKDCYYLLKDKIVPFISRFRTMYNHNQYIYPLYEFAFYETSENDIDFFYTQLEDSDFKERLTRCEIVCPNVIKNNENKKFLIEFLKGLCE